MSQNTLIEALKYHKQLDFSSFHTPGHKNSKDFFKENLLEYDYTEIKGLDSLFEAKECILETEKRIADLINANRVIISSAGCTSCIQTMLHKVAISGYNIICSRIIHESAINTIALLNLNPVWVLPREDSGEYLSGRIYAEDVEEALNKTTNVCAVYITSPDYYGVISDIGKIKKICLKYDVPLIVDSAHGAHLSFVDKKLSPSYMGADMTAYSAHKTLPVLTGGAWLSINNEKYVNNCKSSMALFASTSPSYPIMASIDLCRKWLDEYGHSEFKQLCEKVYKIKNLCKTLKITMPVGVCDPTRISINTSSIGISGQDASEHFRKYKVEPEFYDDNYIVFICTPFNTNRDFERLYKAISTLEIKEANHNKYLKFKLPVFSMTPNKALFSRYKTLEIDDCCGKTSAQTVFSCPPGIPLVVPGELITEYTVRMLRHYGKNNIKVVY